MQSYKQLRENERPNTGADMTEQEYNSTPQALYRQGKITRSQLAHMLEQEIRAMLRAERKARKEKTHTCK